MSRHQNLFQRKAPNLDENRALVRLKQIPGLGPRWSKRLLDEYGSATSVLSAIQTGSVGLKGVRTPRLKKWRKAERALTEASSESGHSLNEMIGYFDTHYPKTLREIPDPPLFFRYRGDRSALLNPCVAIVGTRRPTADARRTS